ncbi:DNA gyrase/topoisomerase IV subunit A [Salinibacter grassmerensis]|uniref:DNA gyrase/topoisomerase IV subunit A n=1 Tax=Salinibacter grassmerensis TaxID=3040353 RepID=UPI0021E71799|nr:DNA topoisomerase (ATP-hydrolyzing) [Salinibacter grassmerensis]
MPVTETIPLHETARERYLNYALSVITSRALPDIRDGLKPVQRRILFAMFDSLNLYPSKRHRKSATVVGETMGKYHPHGDKAIYDAMVRMAQSFSLRAPLVDGHGNFGSLDGDSAAAMRYTEAKLQPLAMEMLEGLRDETVDYRDNFDGSLEEPVVLPARVPNLLVNGASGIAVGMATNIPPHNLGEVVDAALHMIEEPEVETSTLVRDHIQGPDFPTGGRLLNTQDELTEIYETGSGTIEMRGAYRTKGKTRAILESVPYGVDKSKIVEEIADHIAEENVPQLSNVRDESTDDVRIVLELKRGSDTEAAMAYLFKHTKLQKRFHVNLTCLVPTESTDVKAPKQVDLRAILRYFLDFRLDVVTRRLQNELEELEARIHILEGFETIFDALDEAIEMIRASKNKADAAQRLMHRFQLGEEQTDAILETQLYKLSQMEMEAIRDELGEKRARAEEIRRLLDDEDARWDMVREELQDIRDQYTDERRSTLVGPKADMEYTEEDYIVDEDVHVIVTRDGWVKRQGTYSDLDAIRTRDGDEVGWALAGSTRATVGFFTNYGTCYTTRITETPSTTGYGDPVQKLFSFDDGEHVVGVVSFDERALPDPVPSEPSEQGELFDPDDPDAPDQPYVVALSKSGQATRFTLDGYLEPSISTGRKYMRLEDEDEVARVHLARGDENICLASHDGRALVFPVHQVSVYKGPAKGVRAIRLEDNDRVLDFTLSRRARQGLAVETNNGREEIVRTTKFDATNRGAKGTLVIKRGYFAEVFPEPVEVSLNETT